MLFIIIILSHISKHLERYNKVITIYLEIDKTVGLPQLIDVLSVHGYEVLQLEKHKSSPEGDLILQMDLNLGAKILHSDVIYKLSQLDSIHYIEEVRKL